MKSWMMSDRRGCVMLSKDVISPCKADADHNIRKTKLHSLDRP